MALTQVLGAVDDISAQDVNTICAKTTYEPIIDGLDIKDAKKVALRTAIKRRCRW